MLTIFTIPKSFTDPHINIIQRNAILSWLQLKSRCEIILMGNDPGVAQVAHEFSIRHLPEIKKNEFGTPLLNSAFSLAQKTALHQTLAYINADIILLSDFLTAIKLVNIPMFLLAGRRWNMKVETAIQFQPNWENQIRQQLIASASLCRYTGIDYFVFPKNLPFELPPFAVGRVGWDNWLLYKIRALNIPLIEATPVITAIHQSHHYSHCAGGEKGMTQGPEARANIKLTGGLAHAGSLRQANLILTPQGLKPKRIPRIIQCCWQYLGALPNFYPKLTPYLTPILLPGKLIMTAIRKFQAFRLKKHFSQSKPYD